MMKAHHGCSQLVFDHNQKQRKISTSSMPGTPRGPGSLPPSSHTTPRDNYSIQGPSESDNMYGVPNPGVDTDGNILLVSWSALA